MSENVITIPCELISETELAWLVDLGEENVWVPKSKCDFSGNELQIPEWLAVAKGLV